MGNFLSNQVIESMYGGNRSNSRNFQDHVSCPIPDVSNRYNDDKWDQHVKDCNDNGHTEDGLLFQTTFTKYSDGVVRLTGVDVLPTWCYRYKGFRLRQRVRLQSGAARQIGGKLGIRLRYPRYRPDLRKPLV